MTPDYPTASSRPGLWQPGWLAVGAATGRWRCDVPREMRLQLGPFGCAAARLDVPGGRAAGCSGPDASEAGCGAASVVWCHADLVAACRWVGSRCGEARLNAGRVGQRHRRHRAPTIAGLTSGPDIDDRATWRPATSVHGTLVLVAGLMFIGSHGVGSRPAGGWLPALKWKPSWHGRGRGTSLLRDTVPRQFWLGVYRCQCNRSSRKRL